MEFADLGRHCSMVHCLQQDFLPFKCEFCKEIFCAEHRRPEDHKCQSGALDAVDDNYVIVCPLCQSVLKLKGLAQQGITPAHLWNEHVETGECQMKQNTRWTKSLDREGDRATHCQAKGCKTKLTDVNYFKCPKCAMDLCMKHRFDDLHDCKPVKKSDQYEKIKSNISLFNWK